MFLTTDNKNARLPAGMAGKPKTMPWRDYCLKLFRVSNEVNGRDDIVITLHVNRREEMEILNELSQWGMQAYAIYKNDKPAQALIADRLDGCTIAGCKFKADMPELI